jgi:hypothetical protein
LFYLETLVDTAVIVWNLTDRGIAEEKMSGDGRLG